MRIFQCPKAGFGVSRWYGRTLEKSSFSMYVALTYIPGGGLLTGVCDVFWRLSALRCDSVRVCVLICTRTSALLYFLLCVLIATNTTKKTHLLPPAAPQRYPGPAKEVPCTSLCLVALVSWERLCAEPWSAAAVSSPLCPAAGMRPASEAQCGGSTESGRPRCSG